MKKFSATEKVIFGMLSIVAIITAVTMALRANSYFMSEVPSRGGELHEGLVGLPHTVNPVLAVTDVDRDIGSLVYAGLTKYRANEIEPDLAETYSISPDGLTYTFELRKDLKFQDGSPLTASDVIFTIEKIKDPMVKSPRAADWAGVVATSTSPTTVKFTLRQPYSAFLTNTTLGILPKKIWGNVSNEQFVFSEFNIKPVGAGPYKVKNIDRDQGGRGIPTRYKLEAWNEYHGDRPFLEKIVFSFFPDIDHAMTALNNGSIDSLSSVPSAAAVKFADNKGEPYVVMDSPLTRIFGIFFNQNKNSQLGDINVRKALDISVDRKQVIQAVLDGYGTAITSPLPPQYESLSSGSTTLATSTDQEFMRARALIEKSGWRLGSDGFYGKKADKKSATTTLGLTVYTADSADLKRAAEAVKRSWETLGVRVTVKVFEPTELYQNVIRTREYDALLIGQAIGISSDLYSFWHSSQRNAPGLNVASYTNSKVDRILDKLRAATSTDDKMESLSELKKLVSADVPAVFLYAPDFIYVVPKKLEGLTLPITSSPHDRFSTISDWYLETENVWNIFARK